MTTVEAFVIPGTPYIEIRGQQQMVNVDLLIRNHSAESYRLIALRLAVLDGRGKLEIEREVNQNGMPPALGIVGDLALPPDGAIDVFQPFTTFDRSVDLSQMGLATTLLSAMGMVASAGCFICSRAQ